MIIVIVGPTGIGKTDLSIKIAKHYNTEIISGDSVQVYRRLDIGSGKVLKDEMDGIKHHLIDILDPIEDYSVSDFQKNARFIIDELSKKEKLPIICGGTGYYIKAALYDYEFTSSKRTDKYDNLSDEETMYWKIISGWVSWFQTKYPYIENEYNLYKDKIDIITMKQNIMLNWLTSMCPTSEDDEETKKIKNKEINKLVDYLIECFDNS